MVRISFRPDAVLRYPPAMLSFAPSRAKPKTPQALLSLSFAFATAATVLTVLIAVLASRRAEHLPRQAGDGPVVMTGRVSSMPQGSLSPLGDDGSAWVGALGSYQQTHGEKVFVPLCAIGNVDDIALRPSTGLSLRLSMVRSSDEASERVGLVGSSASEGRIKLDFGPLYGEGASADVKEASGDQIPPRVRVACGDFGGGAVYRERVLPAEAEVSVLGCKRGNELVPCGDGLDLVTVQSVDKVNAELRRSVWPVLGLGGVFSLVVFSFIGLRALSLVSRTARTFS